RFVEDDVAAFWTQRDPHRVGQNVDATQHSLARICMKPDFLCRHGFLPSHDLARCSLFDHAHDVALLRDDEILAVDFDLSSRPLSEQHSVTDFDIERLKLAIIPPGARPGGNDFPFHRLFLGGIGDDNAACRLLLLLDAADEDAILQRSKFHGVLPTSRTSRMRGWRAAREIGNRIECDVSAFKLSRTRLAAYSIVIMLAGFFG